MDVHVRNLLARCIAVGDIDAHRLNRERAPSQGAIEIGRDQPEPGKARGRELRDQLGMRP